MTRTITATFGIFAILAFLLYTKYARAETMVVERIVPPGATLTYAENGSVVRSINVPEGRVRVTIEFNGPIRIRHRGVRR